MNNSPQVNEKGVLERMHMTAMLGCIGECLKSFPVCLYLVFMRVRAENPLSHRYMVAKGMNVLPISSSLN